MKHVRKKILFTGMSALLLGSSVVSPTYATFSQSEQKESVIGKAMESEKNPFSALEGEVESHPLYGGDVKATDLKENIRLIVEVEVNEKARTTPEMQLEQVSQSLISKQDSSSKILHTFTNDFYGFSMETTMEEAMKIKDVQGVKDIRLAKTYEHMTVEKEDIQNAMSSWEEYDVRGDGLLVAVVDSGIDHKHEAMQLSENGKKNAKYTKESIQAKLDETEVDDIWYSDKVPTGYDWADNDSNVIPAKDSHGTHVAGIIGAYKESGEKMTGVAPDVQLLAEKVFSDKFSGAYDDDIAAGIYHAVEMGADVINLSLGSDGGMPDSKDMVQRAIKYATEQGTLVVASAGNAAYSTKQNLLETSQLPLAKNPDIGLVGDPGVTPYALQVASSDSEEMKVEALELNDGKKLGYQVQSSAKKPVDTLDPEKTYEFVYVGEGFGDHVKGLDLEGKIAVAKPAKTYSIYSSLQFDSQDEGAVALMVIPPDPLKDYANLLFSSRSIPAVTLDRSDGNELIKRLQNGEKVEGKLSGDGLWVDNPSEDIMSWFSSYGAPTDLSFKPEITAPGGQIYSTVLNNQYETKSGTSMSSPNVAGSAALLLQSMYENGASRSRETALNAKIALMNTSSIQYEPDTSIPFSPRRQGAGQMQIEKAISTPAILANKDASLESAGSVALKEVNGAFDFSLTASPMQKENFSVFAEKVDTEDQDITVEAKYQSQDQLNFGTKYKENQHIREQASLTIKNESEQNKRFTTTVEYTEQSDAGKNGVQLSVSEKLRVKAGKTSTSNVFMSIPKTAAEGIYEGYVTYTNEEDASESYKVPFAVKMSKPVEYDVYVDLLKDGKVKKEFDFDKDGKMDESNEYLTLSSERVEGARITVNGEKVTDQKGTTITLKDKNVGLDVSVKLPEGFDKNSFVEGFVRLVPKNENIPSLVMPYMGFHGQWDTLQNIDESPVNGDPYLGYTVLWNDMLTYPLGYDPLTNSFDAERVGYSHNAIPTGIFPSFTAFRNLKKMELTIEDKEGNKIADITDFSEWTEDGSPYSFRKNIMSYRDFYYKFDGLFWSGKDNEGKPLEDGQYYYVYESTLNYDGAEPQKTKIPFKIDSAAPNVENINITHQEDGTYKITWDVKAEGSEHIGSFLWINDDSRVSVDAPLNEYVTKDKPELVMISAIDGLRNVGVGYAGDEDKLHAEPFINYWNVSGTNVNETKPASILVLGYKRMDWHIEITDSEGEVLEYSDINNEHSIYGLKWYPEKEYPNGDYYVTVTGKDETGLTLKSEKKKITVKH